MGGGPAGLYSAILLKQAMPRSRVEVHERNKPDDTFGWGVVFSDQTMAGFATADAPSHAAIEGSFYHWDDIDVHIYGASIRTSGHGFAGIERKRLLNILQERAASLGVEQTFQHEVRDEAEFADADLLIASDGVNSRVRQQYAAAFEPNVDVRKCRFIWLGTTRHFPAFTFAFERTEHGWFQIHAYQFSTELSTVIVETREETWLAHGLDRATTDESIEFAERLFGKYLGGARLISNARHLRGSAWLNFNRVLCRRWFTRNIVLIGDAAHTAHFSIGSGTKLAMEDAVALSREIARGGDVSGALQRYQEERELEALKLQSAARNRMEWFENVARYAHLEPLQFTYSLLTGSQRIGHDNLKLRDAAFVGDIERSLAQRCGVADRSCPPMFLPFKLRDLELPNRVVVSPMAQYSAIDGVPNDWHLVHYGSRATGGAGLVVSEMTCVSAHGRISTGCTGLWNETQRDAWRRIVDFVHEHTQAKLCLQLGHSGRKGSTQLGWQEADHPLVSGNWPIISASPLPYIEGVSQAPKQADEQDIATITAQFVTAAELGVQAGFDMIELHMAHGYLLASFLSPLTNQRADRYGGSVENRVRFPAQVIRAVRAVMPAGMPLSVRISASDWAQGGLCDDDLIATARALHEAGADVLDVSTGQTVPWQKPVYGRMYQTPFSDFIRNTLKVPTIAVGNIYEPDHVNSIVASGRADLCAVARPHLANPSWTLQAAAQLQHSEQWWPQQYLSGKSQLERNLQRAALLTGAV
jgi:anthraniloyl-CoA monooxygenase